MIVEANCIAECFDNAVQGQEPRYYYRGPVRNYDTDNRRLNGLTTPRGDWVFQYPGHEGKNPNWTPPRRMSEAAKAEEDPEPPVRITAESRPDRRYKKRSKAANAAMLASRKANREAKKAKLEAEMAQESSAA